MAFLELEVPDEPEKNHYVHAILGTFYLADRGRSFVSGMTIIPQFISVKDITNVLEAHPVYMSRKMLDHCIFELDSILIADRQIGRKQQKTQKQKTMMNKG